MSVFAAISLVMFIFGLGRASNEKTPVVYVDKAGEVTQRDVVKPVLIVETDDGVTVRSARKVEPYVNRTAPFRKDSFGDYVVDFQGETGK